MMAGPKEHDDDELVDEETGEVTPIEDSEPLPEGSARSFVRYLATLEDCELECSQEFHKFLLELRKLGIGKVVKGKFTLELFVEIEKDQVQTRFALKKKLPPKPTMKSVHWVDSNGNLTTEDPRQQKLKFKSVGGKKTIKGEGEKPARA